MYPYVILRLVSIRIHLYGSESLFSELLRDTMAIIETASLVKDYGKVEALRGITMSLSRGAVGLLGPNGAGKTTLLRILLGLTIPTSGSFSLLGTPMGTGGYDVRRKIGYMPEHECLIPTMTAVSFISHMAMLNGLSRQDAMKRAHEGLHYVGIGDERYRMIKTYSTGMRQKVKFAQAIAHDPGILFLDEPTNGMDPEGRKQILTLIRDIHRNHGKSVILSSHLLTDVEAVCDHVVLLDQGSLVLEEDLAVLKSGDKNTLDIKIKGDDELFEKLLRKAEFEFRKEGPLYLVRRGEDSLEKILRICAENDIQLRYANQSLASLEDIFLETVRTKRNASRQPGGEGGAD